MSPSYSAALPIAYIVLRILMVINWLLGACILALLAYHLRQRALDDDALLA